MLRMKSFFVASVRPSNMVTSMNVDAAEVAAGVVVDAAVVDGAELLAGDGEGPVAVA